MARGWPGGGRGRALPPGPAPPGPRRGNLRSGRPAVPGPAAGTGEDEERRSGAAEAERGGRSAAPALPGPAERC